MQQYQHAKIHRNVDPNAHKLQNEAFLAQVGLVCQLKAKSKMKPSTLNHRCRWWDGRVLNTNSKYN